MLSAPLCEWRQVHGARRKSLHVAVCRDDGAEISATTEDGLLFCVLPRHVVLEAAKGWRSCGTLPLFRQGEARLWLRWPSEGEQWEEDVRQTTALVRGPVSAALVRADAAEVSVRAVTSEEDVQRVMSVLRAKFGAAGERWYEPSEISESFVRSGVFVVCDSKEDGPIGCCGASDIRQSAFAAALTIVGGREYHVREGWELTHYAVLGVGDGKYAGIAARMQECLLARLAELRGDEPRPVLLDATFDRSKPDGGGAWKLGARDDRYSPIALFNDTLTKQQVSAGRSDAAVHRDSGARGARGLAAKQPLNCLCARVTRRRFEQEAKRAEAHRVPTARSLCCRVCQARPP